MTNEEYKKLKKEMDDIDANASMSMEFKVSDGRILEFIDMPSLKQLIEASKEAQKTAWYAWNKLQLLEHHFRTDHKEKQSEEDFNNCAECGDGTFEDRKKKSLEWIDTIMEELEKNSKPETNPTDAVIKNNNFKD